MGRRANVARASGSHSKRQAASLYLVENDIQIAATRTKKTWSQKDCIDVSPLTDRQEEAFKCWYQRDDSSLAMTGSAGTGKTLCAIYLAINDVLNPNTPQKQLIIVRSTVPSRTSGFLPGSLEEKEEIYQLPYADIFSMLFKRKTTYKDMVEAGLVKFVSSSYVRGLTFDNSVVVVDELQNFTRGEIDSVVTRLGHDSRLIMIGDGYQDDLRSKRGTEVSGFDYAVRVMKQIDMFDVVQFTHDDIVRSAFCKSWIIESEKHTDL